MKKTSPDPLLLGIGILLPFLMVVALPGLYFHKDLQVFWEWAAIWASGWRNIYITCADCNYPILGMINSAGLVNLLSGTGFDRSVFIYRLFLSLVDGLNIWLIFKILTTLKVAKSAYVAGLIGISISSWVGGALWGQTDGINQFLILITLYWVVYKNSTDKNLKIPSFLSIAIGPFLMANILLSKQLTIFSAFSIGLLLAADLLFCSRTGKTLMRNITLTLIVFLVTLFAWDPFLALKPPYFSHLVYVWQEGIFQAGIISGNGFNIWMLLGRDMWSSAHVPLMANATWANPYQIGQMLFAVLTALISLSLALYWRTAYLRGEQRLTREILLNFILHLALINLCFNVFLTGTRERYLFHFYPFILIAFYGLVDYGKVFTKRLGSFLVIGANLYGIFVLQILSTLDFRVGTGTHLVMSVFHAGLFAWLLIITLKYQNFFQNLVLIYRKPLKNLPTVR